MDSSCLHIPAGWNLWLRIYKTLHINPSILLINKRVLWHYNNRHDNTSSHRSEIILKGTTHLQNTLLWFNRERENRRKLSMKTTFNQRVLAGMEIKAFIFYYRENQVQRGQAGCPMSSTWSEPGLGQEPQSPDSSWRALLTVPRFGLPDPYSVLSAHCFGRETGDGRGSERSVPFLLWFLKRRPDISNGFGKVPVKCSWITKQDSASASNPLHVKRLSYSRLCGIPSGEEQLGSCPGKPMVWHKAERVSK